MRYLNVEKVELIAKDTYELFLVKDDLEFKVGNCISIYGPDGKTSRPYSFASGVNDPFFSFIIKKFKDGYVSTYLTTLKQGDRVKLSNPFGWFNPGSKPNSVFISTGTGISPFVSSIRSNMNTPKKFYYGCRTMFDCIDFVGNLPNLHIALSKQDNLGLGGYETETFNAGNPVKCHGMKRVTDLLKEDIENKIFSDDTHFYICGLDDMIQDCIELLTNHNIDLDHIHHEVFFHSET